MHKKSTGHLDSERGEIWSKHASNKDSGQSDFNVPFGHLRDYKTFLLAYRKVKMRWKPTSNIVIESPDYSRPSAQPWLAAVRASAGCAATARTAWSPATAAARWLATTAPAPDLPCIRTLRCRRPHGLLGPLATLLGQPRELEGKVKMTFAERKFKNNLKTAKLTKVAGLIPASGIMGERLFWVFSRIIKMIDGKFK